MLSLVQTPEPALGEYLVCRSARIVRYICTYFAGSIKNELGN